MTTNRHCVAARQTITALDRRLADHPALDLAIQGFIHVEEVHFPEKAICEAAAHMENCTPCQAWSAGWLDHLDPVRVTHRARLAKYCCAQMFGAVTDPEAAVKFSFELFRAEDPCWQINEAYAFARFCPWCGHALPSGDFESSVPADAAGSDRQADGVSRPGRGEMPEHRDDKTRGI